jgi:hypothetical protein
MVLAVFREESVMTTHRKLLPWIIVTVTVKVKVVVRSR